MLENCCLCMGNLQVTQNSCSREWTSLTCVLGALIRNGMGILSLLSIPYVLFMKFYEPVVGINFLRFYVEAFCAKVV